MRWLAFCASTLLLIVSCDTHISGLPGYWSEPTRYLLWRPVILEFNRYDPLQISVPGEQTSLRTACRLRSGQTHRVESHVDGERTM
jgi:hypothetical protein